MIPTTLMPAPPALDEPPVPPPEHVTEGRAFLPEWRPNIDHLVFEDGQPVESPFAERQMRLWVDPLYTSWCGPPEDGKFAAMCNVGLFNEPKQTQLVPDGLLSAGVVVHPDPFPREHQSYLIWEYGKPPDAVMELVSDKRGGELTHKRQRYAFMKVTYYVVYDPYHVLGEQDVYAFQLEGLQYVPMAEAWFPDLGLGLKLWEGAYQGIQATWLRWHTAHGAWLRTGEEQRQRAEQAEGRAETARQQVETAQQQAETARQQAETAQQQVERERAEKEKLLAQLRALGIQPEL